MILRIVLFLIVLGLAVPAQANDYAEDSLANFARTLVHFNALDVMNDDNLLDEYAMITDCDVVESFYSNDFRWKQVRNVIRDSIKLNMDSFPTGYHHDAVLQLDRYDFKNKTFRFTDNTMVRGVNTFNFSFIIRSDKPICNDHRLQYIPASFDLVIGTPVSIGGLPLSEDDAKTLLDHLEKEGNDGRVIYARFNMSISYIEPLRKVNSRSGSFIYTQNGQTRGLKMRFDARLDSVSFYEDPEMTKLIFSFTP